MASVGVQDLRRHTSELLKRIEAGETIEVTDRGRPVAVLSPLLNKGALEQLKAAGDLIPGQGDMNDLPNFLPLYPGQDPPSKVLDRLRRGER